MKKKYVLDKCIICNYYLDNFYEYSLLFREICDNCNTIYYFRKEKHLLADVFLHGFEENEEIIFSYRNNIIKLPSITIDYVSSDKTIDNAYFLNLIKKYLENRIFI